MGAKVRLLVMISGSVSGSALFRNSRVENKEKSLVTKIKTFYKLPHNKHNKSFSHAFSENCRIK